MKKLKGSLTVEAAFSLPFFIIAISFMIICTKFLQTQAELNMEAADKARELAKLSYMAEENIGEDAELIEIAKGKLLNGKYFERLAVARPFIGRLYYGEQGGTAEDNRIVFVTKSGRVYHTSNICSHIRLSVREVDYSSVKELRNNGGAKYYPCEYCGKGSLGGRVYITDEGNRVHKDRNCVGLKRTIIEIKKIDAEAKGYAPCERCGNVHD